MSISVNLGFLGVFKYYNFFASSFAEGLQNLGLHVSPPMLSIILPVGISFYTFHGLSYVIDIYKGRIEAERDFVDYSVFVSFFPLLVAGPIERATHLLPQIKKPRSFDYSNALKGLRQILWGLFKKIVIADQCAEYVNMIFNNQQDYSGSTLVVGAVLFALQIYGDFSGYSDIALGTARLLGISLLKNFAFPYFSRDIAEFWRRWHISLSSWFRDYVYIPLGGSKGGMLMRIRNTLIIFLISGFWHGANWTFIFWGLLNALFIIPSVMRSTNRSNLDIVAQGRLLPTFRELLAMCVTFGLTVFAWIFFRSETLSGAFDYIAQICSPSLFTVPAVRPVWLFIVIALFLVVEWIGREQEFAIAAPPRNRFAAHPVVRMCFYYLICMSIIFLGNFENNQFIYFQF